MPEIPLRGCMSTHFFALIFFSNSIQADGHTPLWPKQIRPQPHRWACNVTATGRVGYMYALHLMLTDAFLFHGNPESPNAVVALSQQFVRWIHARHVDVPKRRDGTGRTAASAHTCIRMFMHHREVGACVRPQRLEATDIQTCTKLPIPDFRRCRRRPRIPTARLSVLAVDSSKQRYLE